MISLNESAREENFRSLDEDKRTKPFNTLYMNIKLSFTKRSSRVSSPKTARRSV